MTTARPILSPPTPARPPAAAPAVVAWRNLGVLRGIAIGLVVLHHVCEPVNGFIRQAGAWDTEPFYAVLALSQVCIPIFVFVSGYFMARFSASWPAARGGARLVLGRYALWTAAHYAVLWIAGVSRDPLTILHYAITGGDRPHWFLVLVIQLYLLTPLALPWVRTHVRSAIALAVGLQLASSAVYYLRFAGVETHLHRELVLMQAPFYVFGLLASCRSEALTAALAPRRRWLGLGVIAACAAALIEYGVLRARCAPQDYFAELLTLKLAGLGIVLWAFVVPSRATPFRDALNYVGMRSLGVLLVHKYVLAAAVVGLWHFERVLHLTTRPRTEPPMWLFGHVWGLLPLFAAGLLVPLLLIALVERWAGKQVRTAIFG